MLRRKKSSLLPWLAVTQHGVFCDSCGEVIRLPNRNVLPAGFKQKPHLLQSTPRFGKEKIHGSLINPSSLPGIFLSSTPSGTPRLST